MVRRRSNDNSVSWCCFPCRAVAALLFALACLLLVPLFWGSAEAVRSDEVVVDALFRPEESVELNDDGLPTDGGSFWWVRLIQKKTWRPGLASFPRHGVIAEPWATTSVDKRLHWNEEISLCAFMEALTLISNEQLAWQIDDALKLSEMAGAVGWRRDMIHSNFSARLSGISVRNETLVLEFTPESMGNVRCSQGASVSGDDEDDRNRHRCSQKVLQLKAVPAAAVGSRRAMSILLSLLDAILQGLEATGLSMLGPESIRDGPILLAADLSIPALVFGCDACGSHNRPVLVSVALSTETPLLASDDWNRNGTKSQQQVAVGFSSNSLLKAFLEWEWMYFAQHGAGVRDSSPRPFKSEEEIQRFLLQQGALVAPAATPTGIAHRENIKRRRTGGPAAPPAPEWVVDRRLDELAEVIEKLQRLQRETERTTSRVIQRSIFERLADKELFLISARPTRHALSQTGPPSNGDAPTLQLILFTEGDLANPFSALGDWQHLELVKKQIRFVFDRKHSTMTFFFQPPRQRAEDSQTFVPAFYIFVASLSASQVQALDALPPFGEFVVPFSPTVFDPRFLMEWSILVTRLCLFIVVLVVLVTCCWHCCCYRR